MISRCNNKPRDNPTDGSQIFQGHRSFRTYRSVVTWVVHFSHPTYSLTRYDFLAKPFVGELARRISTFDGEAIAETKRLVNLNSLPSDAEIVPEWEAFKAGSPE